MSARLASAPSPDYTVAARRRRAVVASKPDAELFALLPRYAGASYARHQLRRFILAELASRGLATSA